MGYSMCKARKDDDFMNYVQQRLEHWAQWFTRGNYYGLGYKLIKLIEYVLMTVGIIVKSTLPKPLPCDEEAEEIEALIKTMCKQNEYLANTLRHYYLTNGSLREKAARLNISHVHFKYCVDMAHQWLAGRLSSVQ